ncbi:MAG: hypothetical protein QF681_15950 [Vicinamibacterales bacterium]|jgi:hypothetical protein|nr:hypothetical protein [Vicinamibacterales bacterium]
MKNEGTDARPVGRVLRLLLGVLLVVESGRYLVGKGLALVAMAGGVVVGEFLFYAVLHLVIVRLSTSINRWVGALLAVMPVLLVFALSAAPGRLGTMLFVGISLFFTALRNDAGCEVMTLPGMVFGRRTHLVCVALSPVDWIEEKAYQRFGNAVSS